MLYEVITYVYEKTILSRTTPWAQAFLLLGLDCSQPPLRFLPVNILNPIHGLSVADFTQIPLGSGQVWVPENDFRHDFNRNSWLAGIGGGMSPEIMGLYINKKANFGQLLSKLFQFILVWTTCKRYKFHSRNNHFRHWYRITSYNVCYTKLLRIILRIMVLSLSWF